MKTLVFVGCNSSDDVVRLARVHHRSYLFEPLPEAAAKLREKVSGIAGAQVLELACGESAGLNWLNVYNTDGLSSSLGTVTDKACEMFAKANLELQKRIPVSTVNLLDFLRGWNIAEVTTLVIDAQGMDLAILKTLEPMLLDGAIKAIRTEADGVGFQHYEGVPDNSVEQHRKFMDRFSGYQERKVPGTVSFHPDLLWELKSEGDFSERLERLQNRVYC